MKYKGGKTANSIHFGLTHPWPTENMSGRASLPLINGLEISTLFTTRQGHPPIVFILYFNYILLFLNLFYIYIHTHTHTLVNKY